MNYDLLINYLGVKSDKRTFNQKLIIKDNLEKILNKNNKYFKEFEIKNKEFFFKISEKLNLKHLKSSEKLFKMGDVANKMFIVFKGNLSLYLPLDNRSEIKNNKLDIRKLFSIDKHNYKSILQNYFNYIENNISEVTEILTMAYDKSKSKINFCKIFQLFMKEIISLEDIYFLLNEDINYLISPSGLNFKQMKNFNNGDIIGEMFLFTKDLKFRSGTVVSTNDSIVGIIEKSDFQKIFNNISYIKIIDHFKKLFPNILEDVIIKLVYNLKEKKILKEELIFNENNKIINNYFIFNGKIQIIKNYKDKKINLSVINSNEFIGEDDILNKNCFHSYSAKVVSKICIIYEWKISLFNDFLEKYPKIYTYFNKISNLKRLFRKKLEERLKIQIKNSLKTQKYNLNKLKIKTSLPKSIKKEKITNIDILKIQLNQYSTKKSKIKKNSKKYSIDYNFALKASRRIILNNFNASFIVQSKLNKSFELDKFPNTINNNKINIDKITNVNLNNRLNSSFELIKGIKTFKFKKIKIPKNYNVLKRNVNYKKNYLKNK